MTLLRSWRFLTVVLAVLAMTTAHVQDLSQTRRYEPEAAARADTTLYQYLATVRVSPAPYRRFATVGAVCTIAAFVAVAVLVFLVRGRRPEFGWTLVGATCLLLAFGSWLAVVVPVNEQLAEASQSAPDSVPAVWARLRTRWECGRAAGFVLQLGGLSALLCSILVETSESRPRKRVRRITYWT